jgi:hypothetical protein
LGLIAAAADRVMLPEPALPAAEIAGRLIHLPA